MVKLKVSATSWAGYASKQFTLALEVYLSDGRMIAAGAASPESDAEFDFSEWIAHLALKMPFRVYVQAKQPSGVTLQRSAELLPGVNRINFELGEGSPHEWLEWVTPFRSIAHLRRDLAFGDVLTPPMKKERKIGRVWATLWRYVDDNWVSVPVTPKNWMRDADARQFELDVADSPHLLQIGGDEVAWRLISLPPANKVRVAVTSSGRAEGDSVEVTVARAHPENEVVMSYLSRGAVGDASLVAHLPPMAERLLQRKYTDPISAVAGAYVLFRTRELRRHRDWFENLVRDFSHIADVRILASAVAREQEGASENYVRKMLLDSMKSGLPVFSLGISLLVENLAAMHRGQEETKRFHSAYLAAQAFARAKCSESAYLSFFGKSPGEPSWSPIYGPESSAAATPISKGGSRAVYLARTLGAPRSAKFGEMSVSLPRAPVSYSVLKPSAYTADPVEAPRWIVGNDLSSSSTAVGRLVKDGPLSAYELPDRLLRYSPETRGLPVRKAASREIGVGEPKSRLVPTRRARAYWEHERSDNSIRIFESDE